MKRQTQLEYKKRNHLIVDLIVNGVSLESLSYKFQLSIGRLKEIMYDIRRDNEDIDFKLRRHGGVRQKVYIDYGKKIEVDRQLVMRKLVLLDEYMSGMTLEQVVVKNNISR